MKPSGTIWNYLEPSGTIWNYLERPPASWNARWPLEPPSGLGPPAGLFCIVHWQQILSASHYPLERPLANGTALRAFGTEPLALPGTRLALRDYSNPPSSLPLLPLLPESEPQGKGASTITYKKSKSCVPNSCVVLLSYPYYKSF